MLTCGLLVGKCKKINNLFEGREKGCMQTSDFTICKLIKSKIRIKPMEKVGYVGSGMHALQDFCKFIKRKKYF